MKARTFVATLGALALLVCPLAAGGQDKKKDPAKDPKKAESAAAGFAKAVVPILKDRCEPCHYPRDKKGGLDVTSYAAVMKGGKRPNNIVPGDPDKSLLIKEIIGKDPPMPKNANPLTKEQIEAITKWIKEGARNN